MELIKSYYRKRIGNELDLNVDIKLTQEQEEYISSKILKHTTKITDDIYILASIVYKNLLLQGKVGA